ncbi:MAG: CheR family methyltransferase [Treponemataceae bacterium]
MESVVQNQVAVEAKVDAVDEKREPLVTIDFKMVTFSLAGKDYAIDIMNVKEIAKGGRCTYVPNTAPFILGVYNLRGDIIPIIDLRLFFNIDVQSRKTNEIENMIIVTVKDRVFGVVVDAIDKVVGIQKSSIQPPHPLFGDINIKFIYGIVESNNHLYVLLDIDRIFTNGPKDGETAIASSHMKMQGLSGLAGKARVEGKSLKEAVKQEASGQNVEQSKQVDVKKEKSLNVDLSFIIDGLKNYKKFHTTDLNFQWVEKRYKNWVQERGKNIQFTSETDAESYLAGFTSPCTNQFWTKDYADAVYSVLPDNVAKQIVVWNPGCGKGYESYSLACLFKKRYPDARIRVFAQDLDLLNVSNASLLSVPDSMAQGWYAPFVTKTVAGTYSFSQDIKDIVMFEYHDCANTSAVPSPDLIFCRDMLSFVNEGEQNTVLSYFEEKLKGNGILVLGANEHLSGKLHWKEELVGNICVYKK